MKVLADLLNSIEKDAPTRTILVGVHWTVVCSRFCGLASTWTKNGPHGHDQVRAVGHLQKRSARELAEFACSDNLLEASIGVAAINSLLEVDESRAAEMNAVEVLIQNGREKNVALVGHFPFIPKLRPAVGKLWVFDHQPAADEYPPEAAADLIPQADVVAITSSTLINHTLDDLLSYCREEALVMMVGPSTPLSPVLFKHGVHILSGSKVMHESAVLNTVSQGATFQQVEGVRRLTIRRPNGRY